MSTWLPQWGGTLPPGLVISRLTENTKGIGTAERLEGWEQGRAARTRSSRGSELNEPATHRLPQGLAFQPLGMGCLQMLQLVHRHTQCSAHLTPPPSHPRAAPRMCSRRRAQASPVSCKHVHSAGSTQRDWKS